ncbi:MAG: hypothetical protein CBC13_08690 [Planctomycetia bacterium TMED53]|nr:MAG: hypothetical protein CBC13_08690 [Planctomycetia bacterium TMED53]
MATVFLKSRSSYGRRSIFSAWLLGLLCLVACTSADPLPSPVVTENWKEQTPAQLIRSGIEAGDPWALAHLHLALPQSAELSDQRQQLHELMINPNSVIEIHGADGHRGEQHPHLLLRTAVVLSGPTPDPKLVARVKSELAKTETPSTWQQVNDLAWLLDAAARCDLDPSTPTQGADLGILIERVLADLERADATILPILQEDPMGEVQRPGGLKGPEVAGCWAYTCSGAHLLGALVECDLAGQLNDSQRVRLIELLQQYGARLDWELKFRKAELSRAVSSGISPRRAVREYGLATTKLLGHGLEIMSRATLLEAVPEDSPAKSYFEDEARMLNAEIDSLFSRKGVLPGQPYDPLALLSSVALAHDSLVWERAFGDLCHLFRGLRLHEDPKSF